MSNLLVNFADNENRDHDNDYAKYKATCLVSSVKTALHGLQVQSDNGEKIGEYEIVGLTEILGMSIELIESIAT